MRGTLDLSIGRMIAIILTVLIIFIFVIWAKDIIAAQGQFSYRSIILLHCKEWQDAQCEPNAAELIYINIEGESEQKTFAKLCAKEYNNDEDLWDQKAIESCKTLCMGCPK